MDTPTRSEIGRFMSKVTVSDSCWIWTAGRDHYGYGVFSYRRTSKEPMQKAHRFVYEWAVGKIVNTIDHVCSVRACVNPAHLEDVPQKENARRAAIKCGHNNWRTRPDGRRRCRTCENAWRRKYRKEQS